MIGDTVMITDKQRAEIKITGRTKHYLNVVGEQLSVHQMNNAIEKLAHEFDLEIKEYVVATVLQDDQYVCKWIVGSEGTADADQVAAFLDHDLLDNNKNYKVARSKALKRVEAQLVPHDKIYRWSEEFKKLGGQVKIPRVMKEEDFIEFEQYLRSMA